GFGKNKAVNPDTTITYTVIAKDGCSYPDTAEVTIFVYPPFTLNLSVSDTACFGKIGTATVNVVGNSNYVYSWHTEPPQFTQTLSAPSFYDYDVTVTDSTSGCQKTANIVIPAYPYVKASFLSNPTNQCAIINYDATFDFLDLSSGATQGVWKFGDGTSEPYILGQQPQHTYPAIGQYVVALSLQNAAGCKDSMKDTVCLINEPSTLFIPDAFSPNGDGTNDEWGISSTGFTTYQLWIYDRWGRVVFESQTPDAKWNGKSKGKDAPEGVYTYYLKGEMYSNSGLNNYQPLIMEKRGTITIIR
ncbi:MAG: gliding motility-associated C-terminal domain-containing protein, partial [Bacteroidia bacterium]